MFGRLVHVGGHRAPGLKIVDRWTNLAGPVTDIGVTYGAANVRDSIAAKLEIQCKAPIVTMDTHKLIYNTSARTAAICV